MNPLRRSVISASLTCFAFAWAMLWPDVVRADTPPPAAAAADPTMDSARHHFEAGRAAYGSGDYQTAIREFKAAEALKPSAILSYNIGLANEKLGRRRVAVRYYKRYLDSAPQAPNRAEVDGRISTLEHDIAAKPQSGAAAVEQPSDDPPPPPVPGPGMDPNGPPPPPGEFVPAPDPYAAQSPIMTQPARKRRWWVGLVVGLSVAVVVTAIIVAVVVVETRHHDDDYVYDAKVKSPLERTSLLDAHALPSPAHGAETAPILQVHF